MHNSKTIQCEKLSKLLKFILDETLSRWSLNFIIKFVYVVRLMLGFVGIIKFSLLSYLSSYKSPNMMVVFYDDDK